MDGRNSCIFTVNLYFKSVNVISLRGKLPFDSKNKTELMEKICNDAPYFDERWNKRPEGKHKLFLFLPKT